MDIKGCHCLVNHIREAPGLLFPGWGARTQSLTWPHAGQPATRLLPAAEAGANSGI